MNNICVVNLFFFANLNSHLHDSGNNMQTDITRKMSQIRVQQSTLCCYLNPCKNKTVISPKEKKWHVDTLQKTFTSK